MPCSLDLWYFMTRFYIFILSLLKLIYCVHLLFLFNRLNFNNHCPVILWLRHRENQALYNTYSSHWGHPVREMLSVTILHPEKEMRILKKKQKTFFKLDNPFKMDTKKGYIVWTHKHIAYFSTVECSGLWVKCIGHQATESCFFLCFLSNSFTFLNFSINNLVNHWFEGLYDVGESCSCKHW